jgi:hypothetical protein
MSAAAIGISAHVSLTVGSLIGSKTQGVSFDAASPVQISSANQATSGAGPSISLIGVGFGTNLYSIKSRIGNSGATATSWSSTTSVICQCAKGVGTGWRTSVTSGNDFGTLLSAVTYNLPTIVSGTSQSRSISGVWCSYVGGTCTCQGIVSFVGSDGVFSSSVADSTNSLSCSGGSTVVCYCFNRPFTGGQSVTITGTDFGVDDHSPAAIFASTSAEFTRWVSQSSLICKLPTCTGCGVSSSAQSVVIALGDIDSTSYTITIPYGYVNGTRRLLPSVEIYTPYVFEVPERFKCPYFWERHGLFELKAVSGMICRLEYLEGESLSWILDPCTPATLCDEIIELDINTRALLQTSLTFNIFESGQGDMINISSCTSASCEVPWALVTGHSGSKLPPDARGNPYLMISWNSDEALETSIGWSAVWNISYSRKFKRIESPATRQDALALCNALADDGGGWSLASVSSPLEQRTVAEMAGLADVWIGLEYVGESYRWADGSPVQYSNWRVGEPHSSAMMGGNGTSCTVFCGSRQGLWGTERCVTTLPYICSKK